MRIRTGRTVPEPSSSAIPGLAAAEAPRVRPGDAGGRAGGPRVRMVKLAYPTLSAGQVGDTMMLFRDFLKHLDRLGLCEPATHVSLAFERFRAMYEPRPEA